MNRKVFDFGKYVLEYCGTYTVLLRINGKLYDEAIGIPSFSEARAYAENCLARTAERLAAIRTLVN